MSREIEFRAWDKKTNKKYFVASIDMFGKVVTLLDDRGDTLDFIERAMHNVELMQATGLLDKNGVEIYEGDIIRRGSSGGPIEVEWGEENCGCCEAIIGYIDTTRETGYEVIGNIYENSSLLERK